MKECGDCGGRMEEREAATPESLVYHYFVCLNCGEELLNMQQLHALASQYRLLKVHRTKISLWGQSLGLRIPKELAAQYHLKANKEVALVPEKEGIRIVSGKA